MEEFEGTPGVWDIDIDGHAILSDAGYKVAYIDLIHGTDSDVIIMAAAPDLLKTLQVLLSLYEHDEGCRNLAEYKLAKAAVAKALGK